MNIKNLSVSMDRLAMNLPVRRKEPPDVKQYYPADIAFLSELRSLLKTPVLHDAGFAILAESRQNVVLARRCAW